MSDELAALLIVGGGVAIGAVFIVTLSRALNRHHPIEPPGSVPASVIIARENRCHPAPTLPYTVAEAHMVMQALINCDVEDCADKNSALRVLISAGRVTPTAQLDWRMR